MEPESIGAILGGAFVVLNVGGFWFREWRKHRTWRANGNDLKEIKTKLTCVDRKVGETKVEVAEIKVAVNEQKDQCSKTVLRFDAAIQAHQKELMELAKEK